MATYLFFNDSSQDGNFPHYDKLESFPFQCNISATHHQKLKGWVVTFELKVEKNDGTVTVSDCQIWNKQRKLRIFKTLDNVYKQLKGRNVDSFKIIMSENNISTKGRVTLEDFYN